MPYTEPTTRTTGELITASIWNTDIVNNIAALKTPPSDSYIANEGANYSTSSTSFTNVDATDFSLDITTTGGDVMIGFYCTVLNSGTGNTYLEITKDGVAILGDDGMMFVHSSVANIRDPLSFVFLLTGLAAGTYNFKLQWKVSASTSTMYAGAGTGAADVHPQFWAREVS